MDPRDYGPKVRNGLNVKKITWALVICNPKVIMYSLGLKEDGILGRCHRILGDVVLCVKW